MPVGGSIIRAALLVLSQVLPLAPSSQPDRRPPDLTLMFFTASWCGPCKSVEPILKQAVSKHHPRAGLLVIDYDTAATEVERWGVEEIPVVIVLSGSGRILFRAEGASADTLRDLEAGIKRALSRKQQKKEKSP